MNGLREIKLRNRLYRSHIRYDLATKVGYVESIANIILSDLHVSQGSCFWPHGRVLGSDPRTSQPGRHCSNKCVLRNMFCAEITVLVVLDFACQSSVSYGLR